jgi:hypothetical protein
MSILITRRVEIEVNVALNIAELNDEDINQLITEAIKRGRLHSGSLPTGDGDQARLQNIIEHAYLAAKALPHIPRELVDLFWIVHRRALP